MPPTSAFRKSPASGAGADSANGSARHRSSAGRSDAHDEPETSPMTQSAEFPGAADYGRKISWSPDIPQAPSPNPKVKVTDYVPSGSARRRSSLQIGTSTTIKSGWVGALVRRKQKLQLDLRKRGWNLNRIVLRTLAAVVALALLLRYFAHADRHSGPNSGPRKLSYGKGGGNGKYVDETEAWAGQAPDGGVHQFGADGWLRSRVGKNGKGGRHPIWDLMEDVRPPSVPCARGGDDGGAAGPTARCGCWSAGRADRHPSLLLRDVYRPTTSTRTWSSTSPTL